MIILDTNALITLLIKDKDHAEYKNLVAFLNQGKNFSWALPMPVISEFKIQNEEVFPEMEINGEIPLSKDLRFRVRKIASILSYRNHSKIPLIALELSLKRAMKS